MEPALRDDIIRLLASAIRVNRKALTMLRGDTPYLWKTVSQLRSQGIIRVNKKDDWTIRLTAKGVHFLAEKNEVMCDAYLRYSCGNKPGSTIAHKKAQCKAAEVTAFMMRIGVSVGVDNPSRSESGIKHLMQSGKAFYLMKELRIETEQKVGRAQISRATGVLLSRGMDALVYDTQDEVMGLNGAAERTSGFQVISLRQDVSPELELKPVTKSLVLGYSNLIIKDLMNQNIRNQLSGIPKNRKLLTDAIYDRTITGTDIIYAPMTPTGFLQIRVMMAFTQAEIIRLVFREEEIHAGQNDKGCEACVGKLKCFEMVTMNLSKLARIVKVYEGALSSVGFACMESQVAVFDDLVQNHGVILRVIKDEAFEQALYLRGG